MPFCICSHTKLNSACNVWICSVLKCSSFRSSPKVKVLALVQNMLCSRARQSSHLYELLPFQVSVTASATQRTAVESEDQLLVEKSRSHCESCYVKPRSSLTSYSQEDLLCSEEKQHKEKCFHWSLSWY